MIKIFLIKEGIGMEFREIVTFLQAAKLQSFSKAARQLGYSQAAVTIQIKQLEQELGVHLFDRIGKQTTLTHQGQVFYEYASAIMQGSGSGQRRCGKSHGAHRAAVPWNH